MLWPESRTIWARRHVTTEPELRRTILNKRLPSSSGISRTRKRSLATPPPAPVQCDEIRMRERHVEVVDLVDLRGQGSLRRH
ncbi:MAG: hypothetical protein ACR2LJ_03795 [Acidimicrobiales bacterium]